jgi:hypothetical protein
MDSPLSTEHSFLFAIFSQKYEAKFMYLLAMLDGACSREVYIAYLELFVI